MAKGRSGTIPDEDWERHKGEIVSLYRTTTLPQVMQRMIQRHGFRASTNQYTRMFKKWGIRRYCSGQDWKKIDRCIQKRRSKGKATNVIFHGNPITQDKLEKEIARNVSFTDRIFGLKDVDNVSIPDGFTILTPPSEAILFPSFNRFIRIDNLPWILFNQEIHSVSHFTRIMTRRDSGNLAYSIHDSRPASRGTFRGQPDLVPASILRTTPGLDNINLDSENMIDALPDVWPSWVKAIKNSMPIEPEISESLTRLLQKVTTEHSSTLESIYKTYMVEDNRIDNYTAPNLNTHSNPTVYQFLSLFIFMVTNNLLSTDFVRDVYVWASSGSCSWIFTEILKSRSATIDVFATKLFPVAVQSGDVSMVRRLVSRNVAVDTAIETLWSFGFEKHFRTALSLAVGERNTQMIEALCDLGAVPVVQSIDSAANNQTRVGSLWSQESIGILRTLLNHGANPECLISDQPRGYPLMQAASEGNVESVSLLLSAGADINLSVPQHGGNTLRAAADVDDQLRQFLLLTKGWDTGCDNHYGLQTPIQAATKANNTKVALLLLQSGAFVNLSPPIAPMVRFIDEKFLYDEGEIFAETILPSAFAIQHATKNENFLLVHHLLAAGAVVDSRITINHGDTPLQIAARLGNMKLVSLLLACNADVNAPAGQYNGRTAVQAAAESGSLEIIQMLIHAGANINASPGRMKGRTALQAALEKGHMKAAKLLLLSGADVNAKPCFTDGLTAFQAAVTFGDIGILQELLSYGADINAAAGPKRGVSALHAAAEQRNIELLDFLIQVGADVHALPSRDCNQTALQCAAAMDWMEGIRLLLRYNPDVRMLPPYFPGYSALGWAIHNSNCDMVVLLLDHGASPNDPVTKDQFEPQTAFIQALSRPNSSEIVELLLKRGADINQSWRYMTALDVAIGAHPANVKAVRTIIDHISQTSENRSDDMLKKSLAWMKVECGTPVDIELLQLLLDAGADINAKNFDDQTTILQKSTKCGHVEVVHILLQNGAEVNIPATRSVGTPLQEAIKEQKTEIADILLKNGAEVNAPPAETFGVTALQAAAIRGYVPLALELLERGADVTADPAPDYGRTAIDGAAEHGHLDMLQLLLNAYGDQDGLASVCDQAAGFAESEGHAAIAKWLRSYTAS